jgi:hypothetical protein
MRRIGRAAAKVYLADEVITDMADRIAYPVCQQRRQSIINLVA